MARLKLVLAFFALVILAGGAYAVAYYWKNYFRPNWEVTQEIEGTGGNSGPRKELPDLGLREFAAAEDLLIDGELQAARDRLYYLMEFYPDSKATPTARQILGEINLDLLLSRTPIPGKEEHVVKRGDLLDPIRRKYQTSYDFMMRASGRTNHLIYPGERIVVYPLNFKLRISLSNNTITVLTPEDDKFFKEYKIREVILPPQVRPPTSTKIAEMSAWYDNRPVNFESSHYFEAKKSIRTGKPGLFIRAFNPDAAKVDSPDTGESNQTDFGLMVDPADLEEMFAYLRYSNPVTLVP